VLGNTGHVERSKADLVLLKGVLGMEKMVTAIQPARGIFLAVKCRK